MCQERLQWEPSAGSAEQNDIPAFVCKSVVPFVDPHDYKILLNDWPYGMTLDVVHIIVWIKNRFSVEPEQGDLTSESRHLIDDFVRKVFTERLALESDHPQEQVMWFRNWTGLQSVRGIDHVHVVVRNVKETTLKEWTAQGL